MQNKKLLLGLVTLVMILASVTLAFATGSIRLGRARAQSNSVTATDFYIPAGSDPWGVAFDSSGNVWVAIPSCDPNPTCDPSTPPGKIAVYSPTAQSWTHTYQLPSGYAQPLFLALDAQGNVWFAEPMDNSIGMLTPSTGAFMQWTVPTVNAGPWDVAIDGNGNIWFTEHFGNQIGEFTPSTGTFKEIATPGASSEPYGIVIDKSNNVWFTENNSASALIGEYTAQGTLNEYKITNGSTNGLTPHLITVDPNGNVWWTEGFTGRIGKLLVASASPGTTNGVSEYAYTPPCGSCGTHSSGISTDTDGTVWFDDALQGYFFSFSPTTSTFSPYQAPTPMHPHDGLRVDSQHRVWFTEEFANKLAVAVPSTGTPTPPPSSPTTTATPPPGSVLGQDTFQRANQSLWGKATDGQSWGGDANSNSAFSISSNTGQIAGSAAFSAVLGPVATDSEVVTSGSISQFNNTNFGTVLHWTNANNWYKAYIDGKTFILQRKVQGVTMTLGQVPFTATAGTSYTFHFRITGTVLSANVWPSSGSEPSGWMLSATDSALQSGFCGLRAQTQSSTVATYSSFMADTPSTGGTGGTPTPTATQPTVTVTVTVTATPSVTATITPGSTIAQDTFQRVNQNLWGTASDGQTWGGDANTVSNFAIVNNTGTISGNGNNYSAVLGPAQIDAQVLMTGSITSFANSNLGTVLRWTNGNNWYKAYIDGTNLIVQKKVNGTATILSTLPFAATAGTSYSLRFQIVGNTLSAKVWASSSMEPANWMVTAADSSLSSGYCGLRALGQGGATVTYTSFMATQLA